MVGGLEGQYLVCFLLPDKRQRQMIELIVGERGAELRWDA